VTGSCEFDCTAGRRCGGQCVADEILCNGTCGGNLKPCGTGCIPESACCGGCTPCHECRNGSCANTSAGTSCGTDKVCLAGQCGSCTAGKPCGNNPCKVGQTSCNTGKEVCVETNANEGNSCQATTCDNPGGQPTRHTFTCHNGACQATNTVCSFGCEGTSCAAEASCNANEDLWDGCRGHACAACSELLTAFPFYFARHPHCVKNDTCANLHFPCGPSCPPPQPSDAQPP
jgi:hypothetical protein